MPGLSIQEMRLSETAQKAALIVLKMHPEAYFSDGKRDLETQARRMAHNAILFGPTWLDTYGNKRMVSCLMTHMEENPEECSIAQESILAASFHGLLTEHFGDYFNSMAHVRGDAFDIRYPRLLNGLYDKPKADQIIATIKSLPNYGIALDWVTDQEGKLKVIHAQFKREQITQV